MATETAPLPTIAEDFRLAATLIARALKRMNGRKTTCEHCGSTRPVNMRDINVIEQLGPTVSKLRRWADAIETPEDYTERGEALARAISRDEQPTRRGTTHHG